MICFNKCSATIDINVPELEYLANHLTLDECRKLIAAAHFTNFELPNALSEAELRISKDLSCFELLVHWNSSPGEGKGRSHEVLGHRLRQLGKFQLADWLGRTVFQKIGQDLEKALDEGLKSSSSDTFTLEPLVELPTVPYEDPTEWTPMDSILFAILSVLIVTSVGACLIVCYSRVRQRLRKRSPNIYRRVDLSDNSSSESEEKFDVRDISMYSESTPIYLKSEKAS
ncbi:hypothetical protein HHI36_020738 [Cryptolaemus montrouzieri]|uniref:Death domain-containing protein n=1 Tax=Cryptolaemus montrouzieri TaxID=559131 RepID=A0ABD2NBJ8_9CUCU